MENLLCGIPRKVAPLRRRDMRRQEGCAKSVNNREITMANSLESKFREELNVEEEKIDDVKWKDEPMCDKAAMVANKSNGENIYTIGDYPSFVLKTATSSDNQETSESNGLNAGDGENGGTECNDTNEESLIQKPKHGRGSYLKFTPDEKLRIGALAAEIGNTKARRQLQEKNPGLKLAESTVRHFKVIYLQNLLRKKAELKRIGKRRGKYHSYNEQERAIIGKFAHEHGVVNAMQHFAETYSPLCESTVRGFKNIYARELERRNALRENSINAESISVDDTNTGGPNPAEIISLPRKKRARSGSIPSDVEETILSYLRAIADKDPKMLTTKAVVAVATGVLMTECRSLLSGFGGNLRINNKWANYFMQQHNMTPTINANENEKVGKSNSDKTEGPGNERSSQDNSLINKIERHSNGIERQHANGIEKHQTLVNIGENDSKKQSSIILVLRSDANNDMVFPVKFPVRPELLSTQNSEK